jgi:hypothetical protein
MDDTLVLHKGYLVLVFSHYLVQFFGALALFKALLNVFHIICKIFGHFLTLLIDNVNETPLKLYTFLAKMSTELKETARKNPLI